MGDWALRDIGRAETKVSLGFIDYSNIEDKFNYQEFSLATLPSSQGSKELNIYPAEKWSSHFETFSPLWESLPQKAAYKLAINQDPDAPMQTLIFGYLSPQSTAPDLMAADANYYPPESAYIVPTSSGGGTTPTEETTSSTAGQSFLPAVGPPPSGVSPVQAAASLIKDRPFIPSSIDHLSDDAGPYKDLIIKVIGIQTHNIWNISADASQNVRYLKNYGPYWGDSGYAGATAEQSGEPGAMRVKVNANKGHLLLYRVAPMNCDIGSDGRYPWVFPYLDPTTGKVMHGAMFDSVNPEGYFHNENRPIGGKSNCPNIGFKMTFDVSSEGPRGAFAATGGGVSPSINVAWGWSNLSEYIYPHSNGSNFATSFYVTFAADKPAILCYHDGTRYVNINLEDTPSNFSESTNLKLTVEYLSTSMLIKVNNNEGKLINAQIGADVSGLKGVWTANPNISLYVAGCTATFDFTPVYYNPWSPSSDITLGADPANIDMTNLDGGVHSPSRLGFDPLYPVSGFAKMVLASCFNTYAEPSEAYNILNNLAASVWDAFQEQSYYPEDIMNAAINPFNPNNRYKPESGWPQCIVDGRTLGVDAPGAPNNTFIPIAKIYNYGSGILGSTGNTNTYLPNFANQDPMSSISIIWQVRTTHTTPLIFGFKTSESPAVSWPISPWKDISPYVSKWEVNWNAEQDYKVLRAKGSITLLNPPGYIIDAVSKNRMLIQISDTGYREYANAVDNSIKPYIYRQGTIFIGLTIGASLLFGPGGDVYFTIECVDPIKLLEDYILETNLRFDGVSYFTAFSMLIQASDYSTMFKVQDFVNNQNIPLGGWKQIWRGGPTIHSPETYGNAITWDRMYSSYYYNSMFFGYQPMEGKSYEISASTQLFAGLMDIVDKMHNPAALPLFFFRPSDGMFVFQIRSGLDNTGTSAYRPNLKSEITQESELATYLPLLCISNNEAYKMTADTSNLISHFTVTGSDRSTGLAIKATAINPKWFALSGYDINQSTDAYISSSTEVTGEHTNPISSIFGHLGYKSRKYQNVGNFVADIHGAFAYAISRCWWLMRPVINISDLTVYGMIDYLDDGLLNVDLSGLDYKKALLKQSTISYEANDGTVISRFSVFVFPPWVM